MLNTRWIFRRQLTSDSADAKLGSVLAYVVGADPFWVQAAVIFAACPVGANVYVFAQHYGISVTAASAGILAATGLSLLTVTGLLLLYPPIGV